MKNKYFYTKIASWSEQRKKEYKLRKWASIDQVEESYEK